MSKIILTIAVASLAGLASCFPPAPPPRSPGLYGRSGPIAYDPQRDDYRTERPNDYRGDADYDMPPSDFDQRPPARPTPPTTPGTYPVARSTANPDQVISPFSPFNVIDVEGFKSGQLARDPSNQQIFRIP